MTHTPPVVAELKDLKAGMLVTLTTYEDGNIYTVCQGIDEDGKACLELVALDGEKIDTGWDMCYPSESQLRYAIGKLDAVVAYHSALKNLLEIGKPA